MKPLLYLTLFGLPHFAYNEKSIVEDFISDKARALLIYLAVTKQPHERSHLAELLWSNEEDASATLSKMRESLRKAISNLGQIDGVVLIKQGYQYVSLDPDSYMVDTDQFSEIATQHSSASLEEWQQAVDIYTSDFLSSFNISVSLRFEEWALTQRSQLRVQMVGVLQNTAAAYVQQNQLPQAIATLQQLLRLEPWREKVHRQLMELLARSGQRHRALVQYETLRKNIQSELGVDPSPQTLALYQQIRYGTLDVENALPSSERAQSNSDVQVDSSPSPPLFSLPRLFGVADAQNDLLHHLQAADRPWILSIDGLGGIGKTSLAQSLIGSLATTDCFDRILWVSAKQEEFKTGIGVKSTEQVAEQVALDVNQFVDEVLEQLTEQGLATSPQEKEMQLMRLLKEKPTLVVIDNLETVSDYEALVPKLRELANPSKFLITSRYRLSAYSDVYSLTLSELAEDDVLALLRHEAAMRGIRGLQEMNDETFFQITRQIIDVVGGHPLALNLVLGQLNFLPLTQVLTNLQKATGRQVDEFYTYIYWQAWQALSSPACRLLLAMPMLLNATYGRLSAVTGLDGDELQSALAQLIGLSLVHVSGDPIEPRYRLHRLTETFLMNDVLKWNQHDL